METTSTLRVALAANGVFSLACALPMVVASSNLSVYLGLSESLLWWAGALVGVNALFLLEYAGSPEVAKWSLQGAVWGDVAWVLASVLGLVFWGSRLTAAGTTAVVFVAIVVGYFAWAQGRELWAT